MGHAVSEAAARSVRKGQAVKKEERSEEQILKDIRSSLAAKLAVTPDDVRFLLKLHDDLVARVNSAESAPAVLS